jgi:NADH-quinone oxidoreductase subunit F
MSDSKKIASAKTKLSVGMASCGLAAGAGKVFAELQEKIKQSKANIDLSSSGCLGFCQMEPIVSVYRPGKPKVIYSQITPEKVEGLLTSILNEQNELPCVLCRLDDEEFIIDDTRKVLSNNGDDKQMQSIPLYGQIPFFQKQKKIVLRNCGFIDSDDIDEYIGRGGYSSALKVLTSMKPQEVIGQIKQSGLRGRGGAGFPTGVKWELCRNSKGRQKYVVCNADEGDPGAYMDRSVLEGDPHSILEGMLIGAFAIGAQEGVIYIRTEYPLAIEKLNRAIEQARGYGLLGESIFGTTFNFNIRIFEGAGAFVCGEETSLIASIEGRPAEPKPRPPFPVQSGLWMKPTNINNVETWANVPVVIARGSEWYSSIGTDSSKGTKVFSLVGAVKNTGLVEVPMGTKLSEIIYDVGGGILDDKRLKAIQTGGPSGGCIPAELLEMPVDYEKLAEAGSIMGSGGMVVMDENTCMVDIARYFTAFTRDESCGKCTSCRDGLDDAFKILTKITKGAGVNEDLQSLEELSQAIADASQCGLGKTAPNPVLSTLQYFKKEYDQHIRLKKCPAIVGRDIISTSCRYNCPVHTDVPSLIALIARGRVEDAYEVMRETNPLSILCGYICHHPCEDRCRAVETGGEALSIKELKQFVGDYMISQDKLKPQFERKAPVFEKIAVIGSGPAGLAAAYDLTKLGYDVTIMEQDTRPGGMVVQAIPRFRLPEEVLNLEIQLLERVGVKIKTGSALGKDLTVEDLFKQGYKAVIIATGTHKSSKLSIEGEEAEGVIDGLKFLKDIASGKRRSLGKKVGIIGGGNTAIDAARSAWRSGAEKVTIIYRRTKAEMPAIRSEVEAGLEEGIELQVLTAPVRIISEDGKVKRLECVKNRLGEVDSSGRPRPIPVEGSDFEIELDNVIVGIGQQADVTFLTADKELELTEWGTVKVSPETLMASKPGIFACGDMITGPSTICDSMAHGKKAAQAAHRYLRGQKAELEHETLEFEREVEPVELTEEDVEKLARPKMPCLSVAERKNNFKKVELGLTEEMAFMESRRCLRCDLEPPEE